MDLESFSNELAIHSFVTRVAFIREKFLRKL